MKSTALTKIHESLGAKMVPFAGYNMPVSYEGINIEHETVRTGVGVFDVSHMGEFLAIGENALALLQKVCSNDLSKLKIGGAQYNCLPNNEGGIVDDLIVYRIRENEYLLVVNAYCKNDQVAHIWTKVFEAGKEYGIKPIGLAARDTLRLEMGYCLYGNDINDTTSPIEAGLGWITKFSKDFINAEALKAEKESGPARKLVGFELQERGIPRHGYEIVDANDTVIGVVTSGTMSPSLSKGIGLGYVKTENTSVDTEIFIKVRNKNIAAKVVKLPFYKG